MSTGLSLVSFETARLLLRPLAEDDEDALMQVFANDEAMTWHHARWDRTNVRYILDLRLEHYRKYGFGVMAVVDKATNELVGQAGLQHMDESRLEFVVYIARPRWRQKYGLEASRGVLENALRTQAVTEVYAATRRDNLPVHQLLEALTFERIGDIVHYDLDALLWRTTAERWASDGPSRRR